MSENLAILKTSQLVAKTEYGDIGQENPINLTVGAGEILCFLGGKLPSLFFRLLLGQGQIIEGEVEFDGEVWNKQNNHYPNWYQRIGIGLRADGLMSNMSLQDNLLLPLRYHDRFNEQQRTEIIATALSEVIIDEKYWRLRPHDVPWEIRKRALLARATVLTPKLLLLDSPTELLSWESLPWLRQWIELQSKKGLAILIGTENLPLAMSLTEQFYIKEKSSLQQVGETYWGHDWKQAQQMFFQHWEHK
jgi:ABC-type transporter Mla maintaining outer membrane lipid asymmetry ATPase subunit MlaF